MEGKLNQIQEEALLALEPVNDEKSLEKWQVKYLGRSSELMDIFKGLATLSKEEKPVIGRTANLVKVALEAASEKKENLLNQRRIHESLEGEQIDVTLPGRRTISGSLHPTTQTLREIYRIFGDMGFQIYRSQEVETDQNNFQLLNFPPHHPARDMQDTFFLTSDEDRGDDPFLLRTHTSPGQIHAMQEHTRVSRRSAANPDYSTGDVLPV